MIKRDYYYLTELSESPFPLSIRHALSLGLSETLKLYVRVLDWIEPATVSRYFGTKARGTDQFLSVPLQPLAAMEKACANTDPNGLTEVIKQQHRLPAHWIDHECFVSDQDSDRESALNDLMAHLADKPDNYSVSIGDLVCFHDDLEALADAGEIQRVGNARKESKSDPDLLAAQRSLAALAIGLMKQVPKYKYQENPNAKQLAITATEHLKDEHDRAPPGISETTVRQAISKALKDNPDLKI